MPLTFFSHQAPVLPLKIVAPAWFDGTALVVGSMAPDLAFVLHGTSWYVDAHQLTPQLWLCVPVTLLLTGVIKRVIAGPLAANLPDAGDFHLRDFGRLSAWRLPRDPRGWAILVVSALLGSLSHLVFDSFTHGFGWVVEHVDILQARLFDVPLSLGGSTVYVHTGLQVGGTIVGAGITVLCLLLIGRRRLLVAWYPDATIGRSTRAFRLRLAACTTVGAVTGMVIGALTIHIGGLQDLIIRVAAVTFTGLTVGCLLVRADDP